MKALSKGLFYLSILLIIYGIVAALYGINLFIESPKYAEAAILGGLGLVILIARFEITSDRQNKSVTALTANAEEIQLRVEQLQSEVGRIQTGIVDTRSNVEKLQTSRFKLKPQHLNQVFRYIKQESLRLNRVLRHYKPEPLRLNQVLKHSKRK
jgi:peptidoglycan hydrolase CwlO-like protein